jgi:pyruvate dehydrogenase phosphatase
LTQLFSYLPTTASARYIPGITKHSKTPPYLIAKPDLKYINLQHFRNRNPILLLFTDGIDLLASGGFDAKATRRKDDPSAVVGALLSEQDEQRLEGILGHGAKSKWYEGDGNRAIEILGDLLGGTDAGKLAMTMDPEIISAADNAEFYVDDTSLIVYDIFKSTVPGT